MGRSTPVQVPPRFADLADREVVRVGVDEWKLILFAAMMVLLAAAGCTALFVAEKAPALLAVGLTGASVWLMRTSRRSYTKHRQLARSAPIVEGRVTQSLKQEIDGAGYYDVVVKFEWSGHTQQVTFATARAYVVDEVASVFVDVAAPEKSVVCAQAWWQPTIHR